MLCSKRSLTNSPLERHSALSQNESPEMAQTETDYAAAVADFLRKKGVTRCPTLFAGPRPWAAPPRGSAREGERLALRTANGARAAPRRERLRNSQQRPPPRRRAPGGAP